MYYTNPNLIDLVRVFDQNERKGYLRLDLNENPGGLSEAFIRETLRDITPEFVAQYPETGLFSKKLADYLGTDANHICIVNGSAEGIRYIIQAFTSVDGKIVGVVPSYFMFQVYSEMYGRNFIGIPYNDDLSMDIDNIINALTDDVQMLILLNPNNPVGNTYTDEEFNRLLNVCKNKGITILIDEAYHYFWPKSFIEYALKEKRVLITRTFSKLFSLAGCRLGYVVGCQEDIKLVQKLCTPHNTNAFALLFAEKIISTPGMVDDLVAKFNEGKEYLIDALNANNYMHNSGAGNFIFIAPKTDAEAVVCRMKVEQGILIKSYPNIGKYGTCLRVTIGEKKYMERFMNALLELDS